MRDGYKETWAEIWEGLSSFFITFAFCLLAIATCVLIIFLTYRVIL